MAEDSAVRRTEDTRTAAPATNQDEIPAEIKALPEGSDARNWALRGYNEAREAKARLEALQDELRYRDKLVTDIATSPRGEVTREQTEPAGGRKYDIRKLEFDPFAPDAAEKLQQYMDHRLDVAARQFVDWYGEDRQQIWNGLVSHSTRLAGMQGELNVLFRDHPELTLDDYEKLFAAAPKHDFSIAKTYEDVYRDQIDRSRDAKVRAEVEREVEAKYKGTPDMPAPPVLGRGGPVPRRTPGTDVPRPRSWGDATRQAQRDSAGKLLR